MAPNPSRQIAIRLSCCYFLLLHLPCLADIDLGTDTLFQGQQLRSGESLVSADKKFRLQFFSPGESKNKYLGIFFNMSPEIMRQLNAADPVWVACRNSPVPDLLVTLMIDAADGQLQISYHGGKVKVSNAGWVGKNSSATILDNGNLVLRDGSVNGTLWQSFDYPTDTLLPGMKLGINFMTGHAWSLTSWISNEAPGAGSMTLGGDPNGSSQLIVWWQENVFWTSGVLDKGRFNNTYALSDHRGLNFTYVSNEREKYLTYSAQTEFRFSKVSITSNGRIVIQNVLQQFSSEGIDFSLCDPDLQYPYIGCVLNMLPKCRKSGLKFHPKYGTSVGYGYGNWRNQSLSLFDCEGKCRQNCSCIAYASLYSNGTGCEIFDKHIWFVGSETRDGSNVRAVYFLDPGRATKWWIVLVSAVGGAILLLSSFFCCIVMRRKLKSKAKIDHGSNTQEILLHELVHAAGKSDGANDEIDKRMEMNQVQLFSFEVLEVATSNFSIMNKLGEGGFGAVYKGKLASGQEIAIKRLSRSSGQGLLEFKNEILLIAKLQHDNLVRVLGCCVKAQEKIIVYEYLPNRSLDFFLFEASRRDLLKWTNRMNIIEGVAQGLLYLHKFSRLRVIHRDLKASNILLDQNMNPKISDFGMARIFGKQECEANTNRIVGTHGYMSPEYALQGVVSVKIDVFSFGVLLLEIVSGKKNRGSYHSERPLNLIGLAWELWAEGRAAEIVDPTLDGSNYENEIILCINVGLLCVQDEATDRPSMTEVVSMLTNKSLQLPQPKQPAFFINSTLEAKVEVSLEKRCTNSLSISDMQGR